MMVAGAFMPRFQVNDTAVAERRLPADPAFNQTLSGADFERPSDAGDERSQLFRAG
jgi:hypothetical protein